MSERVQSLELENESLVLDLLEWLHAAPQQYDDVMSAWRTSCPRLTIWEDAVDAGLVAVSNREVSITEAGIELLRARRNAESVGGSGAPRQASRYPENPR